MGPKDKSFPTFTRRQLFLVIGIVAAIVGVLEAYWRWRAGRWEATSLAVVPVMAWIVAAVAYRWVQIMKEQSEGTFSLDLYRADPQAYLFRDRKFRRFVITVGVIIGVVCVAFITAFHLQ